MSIQAISLSQKVPTSRTISRLSAEHSLVRYFLNGMRVIQKVQKIKTKSYFYNLSDNKIIVPYSFEANYPWEQVTVDALSRMNRDLGCMKLVYVPRAELSASNHVFGLIFAAHANKGGCWSALGKNWGYVGSTTWRSILSSGVPGYWQGLSLSCRSYMKVLMLMFF